MVASLLLSTYKCIRVSFSYDLIINVYFLRPNYRYTYNNQMNYMQVNNYPYVCNPHSIDDVKAPETQNIYK